MGRVIGCHDRSIRGIPADSKQAMFSSGDDVTLHRRSAKAMIEQGAGYYVDGVFV